MFLLIERFDLDRLVAQGHHFNYDRHTGDHGV